MENSKKNIIILGSTGSIGKQAIDVVINNPDLFNVVALSTNKNVELLVNQARKVNCKTVLVADKENIKNPVFNECGLDIYSGIEKVNDLLQLDCDLVINAIVGSIGLDATLAVLRKDVKLALANKESLVVGGDIINATLKDKKKNIIPVDSEHSALFQLMLGENISEVNRLILTASGGPFRTSSIDEMNNAKPQVALAHPKWSMGPKITIDSATLANKGLEVMEAHYLFDIDYDKIDVLIHPQSIVHSMIEFSDGSIKAHLGPTDMRIPIQYALTYPKRIKDIAGYADFLKIAKLSFEAVDFIKFKTLKLAYQAGREKMGLPIAYNAANEVAVAAFLDGCIKFGSIVEIIEKTMGKHKLVRADNIEIVNSIDRESRKIAKGLIND